MSVQPTVSELQQLLFGLSLCVWWCLKVLRGRGARKHVGSVLYLFEDFLLFFSHFTEGCTYECDKYYGMVQLKVFQGILIQIIRVYNFFLGLRNKLVYY